jgi:hypothetical protein
MVRLIRPFLKCKCHVYFLSLFDLCDIFDGSDIVEAHNIGGQNQVKKYLALLVSFIVLGIMVNYQERNGFPLLCNICEPKHRLWSVLCFVFSDTVTCLNQIYALYSSGL